MKTIKAAVIIALALPLGFAPAFAASSRRPSAELNDSLVKAAGRGDAAQVLKLLKRGADVDAHDPEDGSTALIRAAVKDHLETARILLAHGAAVDERSSADSPGVTALMLAAAHGSADMIRLLIAHGADAKARDANGHDTVLMWAADDGTPEAAGILLDHGAVLNPRAGDPSGTTPLIEAATHGNADMVRFLMARGADPKAKNYEDYTAADVVCNFWNGDGPCPREEILGLLFPSREKTLEHPQPSVNAYVGAYGEVLTFENDETVSPRMHGPIEDIRIYPKWDPRVPKGRAPVLFQPTKADYKPENFAALGLKQILVIPKNLSGGYDQLDSLLDAKMRSLDKITSRVGMPSYNTEYPPKGLIVWPDGSREFIMQGDDWKYWQIYSESPKNFYIATTGRDPANYDDPDLASLAKYLLSLGPAPLPLKDWRQVAKELYGDALPSWPANPVDPALWIDACYLFLNALFLGLALKGKKLKTRIVGRCLFGFANALAVFNLASGIFEVFTLTKAYEDIMVAGFIFIAIACAFLARHWRARNIKTTLAISIPLAGGLAWTFYSTAEQMTLNAWLGALIPDAILAFMLGLIIALVFSLVLKPGEEVHDENA
ncbi:MAG TPA: ankyrin repeat domain-containing protein [Elusimicrobiota bacterium]|nr:ankyrin repeat domain-containing protein [Elusimicrobiota bacterium]